MKYYSTRDKNVSLSAAEAVKMGLSRDGGLLTPTRIPQIDRAFLERLTPLEYARRAAAVMALYLTDYTEEELLTFGQRAYGPEQFDDPAAARHPVQRRNAVRRRGGQEEPRPAPGTARLAAPHRAQGRPLRRGRRSRHRP